MFNKVLKKIVCATLAVGTVIGSAVMFTGCTTSRPEAEMKLSFNGKTYTLEYTMYRKVAPATVDHFIKLVDEGYYTDLCVHDYTSTKMYAGAYEYNSESEELLSYKPYFETVKTYKSFPHTVWADTDRTTPLYTLYGEFSKNKFTVTNGALNQSFGSLTMYYTNKSECETRVNVKRNNSKTGEYSMKDYQYNSATSQFFISLSDTETSSSSYCTFAKLSSDSKATLKSLQKAIASYIESNFGTEDGASDEFVESVTVDVDEDDPIVSEDMNTATYNVPVSPIVIKSIKITKY